MTPRGKAVINGTRHFFVMGAKTLNLLCQSHRLFFTPLIMAERFSRAEHFAEPIIYEENFLVGASHLFSQYFGANLVAQLIE